MQLAVAWDDYVELTGGAMQISTTTTITQTHSQHGDPLPTVYLVLAELVDGRTADGEYFLVVGAHSDAAAAERRVATEQAGGRWGHFAPDAEWSDSGWLLRVEPVEVVDSPVPESPAPLTRVERRTIQLAPMDGGPPKMEVDQDVAFTSWDGGKSWVLQRISDVGPIRPIRPRGAGGTQV